MTDARRTELDALLVTRAIDGLDAGEAARLDTLLHDFPDTDADEYDRLAAAILLAGLERDVEPMPEHVRARLAAAAAGFASGRD